MNEARSVSGRLAQRTLQTCVRGLVQAVVAVAGVPLFIASLFSLLSLAAGIGILLAPKSLLAVRGLASGQRRWAREWSRVSIAAPYRPRPVELTNGLIGRLQRCKWLLTDPATWRDLLWLLVNLPAGGCWGCCPHSWSSRAGGRWWPISGTCFSAGGPGRPQASGRRCSC
jgi:hypothetical protein